MAEFISDDGKGGVLIAVKAVPGSSREGVAGLLGDRLKVRVAAPAEGGKANRAICEVMARALGIRSGDIRVVSGKTSPEKTLHVAGLSARECLSRLGRYDG